MLLWLQYGAAVIRSVLLLGAGDCLAQSEGLQDYDKARKMI